MPRAAASRPGRKVDAGDRVFRRVRLLAAARASDGRIRRSACAGSLISFGRRASWSAPCGAFADVPAHLFEAAARGWLRRTCLHGRCEGMEPYVPPIVTDWEALDAEIESFIGTFSKASSTLRCSEVAWNWWVRHCGAHDTSPWSAPWSVNPP